MLEFLLEPFRGQSAAGVLWQLVDILAVAALMYWVLLIVRGTRSLRVAVGFVIVWTAFVLAERFHLRTLHGTFSALFSTLSPLVVFMIVLFQDDIRRALARVTRWTGMTRIQEAEAIEHVVGAAEALSREHIGAIIVFEGEAQVEPFVQSGVLLDAAASKELLYSIFLPAFRNPLHDGAVVIKNLRVARAGAFLPSTTAVDLDVDLGTRHRAAIGITEVTDAVSIVVSEERGAISFCEGGAITLGVTPAELREVLLARFEHRARRKVGRVGRWLGLGEGAPRERASQVGRQTIRPARASASPGERPSDPAARGPEEA